ncbi:KH domain-containing protein [Candidatus Saganbacteria bacterium]|nr:KH domain-containing protein [Candidatus Saganbacteria bacterium]
MKELVEYIVRSLVDNPDRVEIKETPGEGSILIEIKVADEDTGKVIGREGRIINAIRTLAKSAAGREQKRVQVEVLSKEVQ